MRTRHHERFALRIVTIGVLGLFAATAIAGCGLVGQNADTGTSSGSVPEPTRDMTFGQSSESVDKAETQSDSLATAPDASSPEAAGTAAGGDRLVIRSVGMRLEVKNVEEAIAEIRSLAAKHKGLVTDMQISTDEQTPVYRYDAQGSLADGAALSGYVTVRVPADDLSVFQDEAAKLGKVLRQAEAESDVTQQHVDMKARLANLQAQETRLRDFFSSAKKVDEMLAIEQELSRVRGEIESMQAQIDYLEKQAAMSTVTIELSQPQAVVRPAGTDWGFVDALTASVRAFVGTVNAIIVVVGGLLPIVIIGLIVFVVVPSLVRRRGKRTSSGPENPA